MTLGKGRVLFRALARWPFSGQKAENPKRNLTCLTLLSQFPSAIVAMRRPSGFQRLRNSSRGRYATTSFAANWRAEENTYELQSLMRTSDAGFGMKKKTKHQNSN